ncbi:MAG: response regulator [Hydrogenophaga sp.]|mgnify:CR=1 FL=1|jgi:signal transduction histidine kinase|uniref:sensor histidine kinase n=1 Tax=Hydrogenophaga sp. TaxID=1904254 RepID=UPI00260BDDCC|nr:response regulator [Hydrogenophaga sp.]MCV0438023.1 response regulator [Hydrogenophaga sp.]
MRNTPPRILIVEDESIVAFNLQQRLSQLGYDVPAVAVSGQESLALVHSTRPDLVLMDIHIEGDMDGIDVAARLKNDHPVPVIYLTAYSEDSTLERARQTTPYGYLIKPFSERELHATIQMALERHTVEESLRENRRLLQQALDAASMGVLEMDTVTSAMTINPRTASLLGRDAARPLTLADFLADVDEKDRQYVESRLRETMAPLRKFSEEFRLLAGPATSRWIKLDASPVSEQRLSGVVQDVTERKHAEIRLQRLNEGLEQLVHERTTELRESLRELETFSYSVAHDLRSPIRSIAGLSAVLLEDHRADLGDEGAKLIARIAAKSTQMGNLIDALLNLSKLSQVQPKLVDVDLSAIAAEIIEQQLETAPERIAEVRIAPGLSAVGDPVLVRSVLDNLIRNAWKFCAKREVTRIEVGHELQGNEDVFYVRDNGCGFDMAYAEQVFSPFRRLHTDTEFQGTGIGLSIVQRIAARHGGRVWADAAPDKGATFYFTLGG